MSSTFAIDSKKLENELKKRNLNIYELSKELGHGRNFIADSLRRSRLSNGAGKMMEVLYHIRREDYEKKPQEQEKVAHKIPADEAINIKDLYTLIYEAVKKANIDARKEWRNINMPKDRHPDDGHKL